MSRCFADGMDNQKGGSKTGRQEKRAKKIPHVPAQQENEKMTKAQKEGVRLWNLMRDTLLENGLMEDK